MEKVQTVERCEEVSGPDWLLRRYHLATAAFFLFVALFLGTLIEMRRAIFFPVGDYLKVGAPSPILYLDWRQTPALLAGLIGAWLSPRYLARLEAALRGNGAQLHRVVNILAIALMVFLPSTFSPIAGCPPRGPSPRGSWASARHFRSTHSLTGSGPSAKP